jgi:hypothetical protein
MMVTQFFCHFCGSTNEREYLTVIDSPQRLHNNCKATIPQVVGLVTQHCLGCSTAAINHNKLQFIKHKYR